MRRWAPVCAGRPGRIMDTVRTAVERHGFVGIKAHRLDACISSEIGDAARAFGLPVPYDPAGEGAVAALLAQQYPDLTRLAAPGQLGRRWGGPAGADRPPGAAREHLHGQVRRAPFRFAGDGRAARRAAQAAVRLGRPLAACGQELHKMRLLGLPQTDTALTLGHDFLRLVGQG